MHPTCFDRLGGINPALLSEQLNDRDSKQRYEKTKAATHQGKQNPQRDLPQITARPLPQPKDPDHHACNQPKNAEQADGPYVQSPLE
jgi:hypothetical protein